MIYKTYRLALPSNEEYSVPQLRMMLDEVENIIEKNNFFRGMGCLIVFLLTSYSLLLTLYDEKNECNQRP